MSLGGLKGKVGLKASPAQNIAKRPRLALGDDEEDDSGKQQEISGWDAGEGGAVDIGGKKEKEAPRVIPVKPNRKWGDEARRNQRAKLPHAQAQPQDNVEELGMEDSKKQYGLTILKKEEPQENSPEEIAVPTEPVEAVNDNLTEAQRLEKKALDALLNDKTTDDDLVIPIRSEAEALYDDLQDAPEAPTLEAYEATPIEGFGAALLRGMGWKDGQEIGKTGAAKKVNEIKRRPALLGIGAKAEAATGIELGAWTGGKTKDKKPPQNYNPVALRNKVTGEVITEEELKAKLEQQNIVQDEKPAKERRKYSDDEEDERRREKRRDRKGDRDRDRRRDDDYDSERRRDRDRKEDRRRAKDDYYDSDRRREKRKDKYKEDEYDSERRRDKRRERTRSPDEKREKRRDRYRSRSRDARRDGDRRERSVESDDRRKRRREREYDDERDDRKRRHRDDKYYK